MLGDPLKRPGGVQMHFDGHLADLQHSIMLSSHSCDEALERDRHRCLRCLTRSHLAPFSASLGDILIQQKQKFIMSETQSYMPAAWLMMQSHWQALMVQTN